MCLWSPDNIHSNITVGRLLAVNPADSREVAVVLSEYCVSYERGTPPMR